MAQPVWLWQALVHFIGKSLQRTKRYRVIDARFQSCPHACCSSVTFPGNFIERVGSLAYER